MSTHAKGPWSVDDTPQGIYVLDSSGNKAVAKVMSGRPDGADNARVLAAAPELLAALQWSEQFNCQPGEGYTDCFERVAETFRKETGFMRPGKDASPQSGQSMDERQAAWDAWIASGIARVRAAIAASVPEGQAKEGK
jgi:hypothetical protein